MSGCITSKYANCLSWLEYYQLVSALPSEWVQCDIMQESVDTNLEWFVKVDKTENFIYTKFISSITYIDVLLDKWVKILDMNFETTQLEKYFEAIYKCTISTKLRNFQYRILTHKVVLNDQLVHYGIKENNSCTFCKATKETMVHIFTQCKISKQIWEKVEFVQTEFVLNDSPDYSMTNVIFNDVYPN